VFALGGCQPFTRTGQDTTEAGIQVEGAVDASPDGSRDAGRSEPADAGAGSMLACDAANVLCDGFERAQFDGGFWNLVAAPDLRQGGALELVIPKGGVAFEGGRAAKFSLTSRDGGISDFSAASISHTIIGEQLRFSERLRIDKFPAAGQFANVIEVQRRLDPPPPAPALEPNTYLNVSVGTAGIVTIAQTYTGKNIPATILADKLIANRWELIELSVDFAKNTAAVSLNGKQGAIVNLVAATAPRGVFTGIVYYEGNIHDAFAVLVDDVRLQITP
jgi:hypothetical protein